MTLLLTKVKQNPTKKRTYLRQLIIFYCSVCDNMLEEYPYEAHSYINHLVEQLAGCLMQPTKHDIGERIVQCNFA